MKTMIAKWSVCLMFVVGCGDVDSKGSSSEELETPNVTDTTPEPVQRDVRSECVSEVARLEGCGQATAEERLFLEAEFCESTSYTDGQVATVTNCLTQWTCGGAMPACLQDTDPAPECSSSDPCESGSECQSGVCQPTAGAVCADVRYVAGDFGDGTEQGRLGSPCTFPGDCLSNRCVFSSGWEGNANWCANKGDCRNPNNEDEACKGGYSCQQVLRETFEDNPLWLCVRDSVGELCE